MTADLVKEKENLRWRCNHNYNAVTSKNTIPIILLHTILHELITSGRMLLKQRLFLFLFLFTCSFHAHSFGVLTHEAIVDAAWDKYMVPLLKNKYPNCTDSELRVAHAYAYGGAVTPDMGYYPLGSHLFTDLVHYVRSGDMVDALLADAENINQYAFALGFLSHYDADNYGHPLATNRSVPLVYKRMKKKYGDVVTYNENKISHIRMEFGFDVLQTAKGNYASQAYHDFIGFKIDTAVLSKAFTDVYGLDINSVFNNHLELTINFFRYVIAHVFPFITRSAWASRSLQLMKKDSTLTSKKFRYTMHRKEYNKEYGKGYKHPGFFPGLLSVVIRMLPKVGPTRALRFKLPNATAEKYFDASFDTIENHYDKEISEFNRRSVLPLKDKDFDTGKPTKHGEYPLADNTYQTWLLKLNKQNYKDVTLAIQKNILSFYKGNKIAAANARSKKARHLANALSGLQKWNT